MCCSSLVGIHIADQPAIIYLQSTNTHGRRKGCSGGAGGEGQGVAAHHYRVGGGQLPPPKINM